MSKKYEMTGPEKVYINPEGNGRTIPLTPTVERILRTRLSKLEYWQRLGRAGLEKYPRTERGREIFKEKLDNDLKDIEHLKEVLK